MIRFYVHIGIILAMIMLLHFCVQATAQKEAAPGSSLSKLLVRVGKYMSPHKFFERDQRLPAEERNRKPPSLMEKFPTPPLAMIPPLVSSACEKSVIECLQLVERISYKRLTREDLFTFRTAASYYLCWYTMLEDPALRYFGSACQVPFRIPEKTVDFRGWDRHPFDCALHNFCPDPCCGGYQKESKALPQYWTKVEIPKGFAKTKTECENWKNFPCGMTARACRLNFKRNKEWNDLISNKLNVTCECSKIGRNFRWDPVIKMCTDQDECHDGTYDCEVNSVCRNVQSDYYCTCRLGFLFDSNSQKCVRDQDFEMSDLLLDEATAQNQQQIVTEPPKKVEFSWNSVREMLRRYFTWVVQKPGKASIRRCNVIFIYCAAVLTYEQSYF